MYRRAGNGRRENGAPADAGMNHGRGKGQKSACGDEPWQLFVSAHSPIVAPAHAGMNRPRKCTRKPMNYLFILGGNNGIPPVFHSPQRGGRQEIQTASMGPGCGPN